MAELRIRDKINKRSTRLKLRKHKFKKTKFVISVDKNIYNKFKSIKRPKETFRATLQSGNVFTNIGINTLNCEGVTFIKKIKVFANIRYILITFIGIRKIKICFWCLIDYILYPMFAFIISDIKSYYFSWISCYKSY